MKTAGENAPLDAAYLVELARRGTPQGHSELADAISSLFGEQGVVLTDRERRLALNILGGIIKEVEISVRKSLSERLASAPDVPRALVGFLANDRIEVAYPMLIRSPVLRDSDLIDIVRARAREYQLAVTLRAELSEGVSDALVEHGGEGVIESLLGNQSARISETTIAYLVEQSKRVDSFQEPLLHRQDLGLDLARKMFSWVSSALREHVVERFSLPEDVVARLIEEAAREQFAETMARIGEPQSDTGRLAQLMIREGMAGPDIMLGALAEGEVALFIALLADHAELDRKMVSGIFFEGRGEPMAIVCKAIDVSEQTFKHIVSVAQKSHPPGARLSPEEIGNLVQVYAHMDRGFVRKTVADWRDGKTRPPQQGRGSRK